MMKLFIAGRGKYCPYRLLLRLTGKKKFDKLTSHYAEPHTYFRQTILSEMLRTAVDNVEAEVKGSELVQKAIAEAVVEIKTKIPEMAQLAMRQMFVDFWNYFTKVMEDRRARPRDDLASVFANARIDGEPTVMTLLAQSPPWVARKA